MDVNSSREPRGQVACQIVAQPGESLRFACLESRTGKVGGCTEGDGKSDVLSAGPQSTLLSAATNERLKADPVRT